MFEVFLLAVFEPAASVSLPALLPPAGLGSFSFSRSPDEPLLRFLALIVVIDLEPNFPTSTFPGVARGRLRRPGSWREFWLAVREAGVPSDPIPLATLS